MNERSLFAAEVVDRCRDVLAADSVSRQVESQPDAVAVRREATASDLQEDTGALFGCLAEAVAAERPALFSHCVEWLHVLLHARGLPPPHLRGSLEAMAQAAAEVLPAAVLPPVQACLEPSTAALPTMPTALPSRLPVGSLLSTAQQYLLAVLENRGDRAWDILAASASAGVARDDLVRQVLIATQVEVGRMWQLNELSIVEEHLASEVAEACLHRLYRLQAPIASTGRRVLTTSVANDQHRIGTRWLALSFESAGWDVVALGADLPDRELVHAVGEFDCDVVCLGATLVHGVRDAARSVAAVRSGSTAKPVAVLVGGQPFRVVEDLWRVVGADATARDPVDAVGVAAALSR